jgi:hypothetical protein
MKLTSTLLESKINDYIDESYAFSDFDSVLSKNVLRSMNKLLLENKKHITKNMLVEIANNSNGESKYIIEDFILFLEE